MRVLQTRWMDAYSPPSNGLDDRGPRDRRVRQRLAFVAHSPSPPVPAHHLRILIIANHLNGKDTHVRGLRIFGAPV